MLTIDDWFHLTRRQGISWHVIYNRMLYSGVYYLAFPAMPRELYTPLSCISWCWRFYSQSNVYVEGLEEPAVSGTEDPEIWYHWYVLFSCQDNQQHLHPYPVMLYNSIVYFLPYSLYTFYHCILNFAISIVDSAGFAHWSHFSAISEIYVLHKCLISSFFLHPFSLSVCLFNFSKPNSNP